MVSSLRSAFSIKGINNKQLVNRFYFYNTIDEYCYENQSHTKCLTFQKVIDEYKAANTAIIIFSDAGAARITNSTERFKKTIRFLIRLKKVSSKVIWINPIPNIDDRWTLSTAGRIAKFVPMVSMHSRNDIENAVDILKGKIISKKVL
jgi:uncharacterized protein with von Willebrand factor type A (vWA) domain